MPQMGVFIFHSDVAVLNNDSQTHSQTRKQKNEHLLAV